MNDTSATVRPLHRTLLAAAALLVVGGTLAGCSASGGTSGTSGPTGGATASAKATTSAKDRSLAINACLRDKGYDVSDERVSDSGSGFSIPEGADQDRFLADSEECAGDAPGSAAAGAASGAQVQDLGPAFAKCVREGGFDDFPDDPEAQAEYTPIDAHGYQECVEACMDEHRPTPSGH